MVGSYVLIVLLLFSILGPWSSIAAANDGAAAPASSSAAAATTTKVPILLEPIVTLHSGVLPPDVCAGLIALGEAAGFPHEGESIDEYQDVEYKVSSQSIEVYERDSESSVSFSFYASRSYRGCVCLTDVYHLEEMFSNPIFPR
jgi:hypothetical protein